MDISLFLLGKFPLFIHNIDSFRVFFFFFASKSVFLNDCLIVPILQSFNIFGFGFVLLAASLFFN